MYVKHFSLDGRPFGATASNQFFVPNDSVGAVAARLCDTLTGQGAVAVVSGGPGVGKTALVAHAGRTVGDNARLAWADMRQAEPESFIDQLLISLGSQPVDGSGPQSVQALKLLVQERHAGGQQVSAAVDLSSVTAERAKRLLRLAHLMGEPEVPLNLVLMGPHTLHKVLDVPGLIHLRQRVVMRHRVRPLAEDEAREYIAGALRTAGGDPSAILGDGVAALVFRYVAGVPRLINTLMDAALAETARQGLSGVSANIVQQVAQGLGWRTMAARPKAAAGSAKPVTPAPKTPSPLDMAAAQSRPASSASPAAAKAEDATAPSEMTAALVAPLEFDLASDDRDGKPKQAKPAETAADAGVPNVPEMNPEDTSATGMLRLEDLDERFAESVFGNNE